MSTPRCEKCGGHRQGSCCTCGYEQERTAHAATKAELAEARNERDIAQANSADRERLLRERDAAQAELLALREMFKGEPCRYCFNDEKTDTHHSTCKVGAILGGTSGRDLAARLSLLEAVAKAARDERCEHCKRGSPRTDGHSKLPATYHYYAYNPCTTPILSDALAALDAAQPTSKEGDDE